MMKRNSPRTRPTSAIAPSTKSIVSAVIDIESLESRRLFASVSVTAPGPFASETDPTGAGAGTIRFTRDGSTASPLTVVYAVDRARGTAGWGDISGPTGSIVIQAGQSTVDLPITPVDDTLGEGRENLVIRTLTGDYTISSRRRIATVQIADNESTVGVLATTSSASETSPSSTGKGQVTFFRVGDLTSNLTVHYSVSGTATSGSDFTALPGTATILAGQSSVVVDVIPIDDANAESSETVIVTVTSGAYSIDTRGNHEDATINIADNDSAAQGWWDTDFAFRLPVDVNVGTFARTDKVVNRQINFTGELNTLGQSGTALVVNSIRVIETNAAGDTVIDANVPFQFDQVSNFNATTNATGTVVFQLKGATAANVTRHYHVYFDNTGSFTAASFSNQIVTNQNDTDQGQAAVSVNTQAGTFFVQKQNGGLSSLVDEGGSADWLGFDPTSGSQSNGEYRGSPNAISGGGFHPGFNNATNFQVLSSGPLKTVVTATSVVGGNKTYKITYEFYPTYVHATIEEISVPPGTKYWILYEGTPGGAVDNNDTVVRADGTVTAITQAWADANGVTGGTDNNSSFVYFRDSAANKFLYMAHDAIQSGEHDSYYLAGAGGLPTTDINAAGMTVFGFGRDGAESISGTHSWTMGLADGGSNFNTATTIIEGASRGTTSSQGSPQHQ